MQNSSVDWLNRVTTWCSHWGLGFAWIVQEIQMPDTGLMEDSLIIWNKRLALRGYGSVSIVMDTPEHTSFSTNNFTDTQHMWRFVPRRLRNVGFCLVWSSGGLFTCTILMICNYRFWIRWRRFRVLRSIQRIVFCTCYKGACFVWACVSQSQQSKLHRDRWNEFLLSR